MPRESLIKHHSSVNYARWRA